MNQNEVLSRLSNRLTRRSFMTTERTTIRTDKVHDKACRRTQSAVRTPLANGAPWFCRPGHALGILNPEALSPRLGIAACADDFRFDGRLRARRHVDHQLVLVGRSDCCPADWLARAALGEVRLMIASVLLFTLFSVLCGLAPNYDMLVFFRLMVFGPGPMVPLGQSIMMNSYPPENAASRWLFGR